MEGNQEPRFELTEDPIKPDQKPDLKPDLPPLPTSDPAPPLTSSKSPSHPQPSSTEPPNMAAQTGSKKKGTAATVKKAPKRPKNGPAKAAKKAKTETTTDVPMSEEPASEEDESDHGPYCICRGPDDHRWMICCEKCEDWFHGECINIDKDIGESLIEKFICPNCTNGNIFTLYKKTCALGGCRKPSRLSQPEQSVFCSNEHAHNWWERIIGKLPKNRGKGGFTDHLVQEEFMALLGSGLSGADEDGLWRLAKPPFLKEPSKGDEMSTLQQDSITLTITDMIRRCR